MRNSQYLFQPCHNQCRTLDYTISEEINRLKELLSFYETARADLLKAIEIQKNLSSFIRAWSDGYDQYKSLNKLKQTRARTLGELVLQENKTSYYNLFSVSTPLLLKLFRNSKYQSYFCRVVFPSYWCGYWYHSMMKWRWSVIQLNEKKGTSKIVRFELN